jgi:hypothetical protein
MTVSLHEIVAPLVPIVGEVGTAAILRTLTAREDQIADYLRLAGAQFGMYPWIIAEVLAQIGLGTPPSEDERTLIRRQFIEGMEELRRQQGG